MTTQGETPYTSATHRGIAQGQRKRLASAASTYADSRRHLCRYQAGCDGRDNECRQRALLFRICPGFPLAHGLTRHQTKGHMTQQRPQATHSSCAARIKSPVARHFDDIRPLPLIVHIDLDRRCLGSRSTKPNVTDCPAPHLLRALANAPHAHKTSSHVAQAHNQAKPCRAKQPPMSAARRATLNAFVVRIACEGTAFAFRTVVHKV